MPWERRIAGVFVLVVLTGAAYLPVSRAGFIWDDDAYVVNNETLRSVGGLVRMWLQPGAIPQYYPLAHTTFWIEYHLWGLRPAGYHAVNVLLHVASAVLVWFLLGRLRVPGAWFVAAIFAVHPVHVESVAWITERKNTLSGLFYLLSLLAYLKFRPLAAPDTPKAGPGSRHHYVLSLLAFAAALLSKTITCSLPAAILLITWWKRGRLTWRDFRPLIPFFLIGAVLATVTVWMEHRHVGALGTEWGLSPLDRILIAGRAVWFYACKLVCPTGLAFMYERWEIDDTAWPQYLYPAAAVALLAVLWLARRRIGRGPIAAVLFFGGTLLPALGFINVYPMRYSFVADHFQYLASLGLITLVVGIVARYLGAVAPKATSLAGGIVLVVLAAGVWHQTHIYRNVETLWRDTLAKTPTAVIALNNLGQFLIFQERADEAIPLLEKAVELRPDDLKYRNNLASAHLRAGDRQKALATYQEALQRDPDDVLTNYNLACVHAQVRSYDAAIRHFRRVVEVGERCVQNQARISRDVAGYIGQAHELLARVLLERTDALLAAGQVQRSIKLLTDTLPLLPDAFEPRRRLADLLALAGSSREAVAVYRECVALRPDDPDTLNGLAWKLATDPDPEVRDGAEAVRLAEQATALRYGNAQLLDTLAAALAETGQFARAIETAERARRFAADINDTRLVNALERRIELYKAKTPYHEPQRRRSP